MKRVQSTRTLTEMVRIVNSSVEDSSGGNILDEDDDTAKLYGGVSIWRPKYGRRTKARYEPLRMEDTLHNKEDNKKDWRLKQSGGGVDSLFHDQETMQDHSTTATIVHHHHHRHHHRYEYVIVVDEDDDDELEIVVDQEEEEQDHTLCSADVGVYSRVFERWLGRVATQQDGQRVASVFKVVTDLLIEEEFSTEEARPLVFTYNMYLLDRCICALEWEGLVEGAQLTALATVSTGLFCKLVADTALQACLLKEWTDTSELDKLERKMLLALDFRIHVTAESTQRWYKENRRI